MAELSSTSLNGDANLEGYYKFNTGALTTDSSGDAETLTNNNTVGETASGQYGYAADFGTANTNKSFSRASNYGITNNSLSIVGWIKVRTEIASGVWELGLHENTTTRNAYYIDYQYNAGTRRITAQRLKESVGNDTAITYNVTLGTSVWHHIALTCNGTTMTLYFDGASVGTPTTISGNGSSGGTDVFRIGGAIGYPSIFADDYAVFSDALTAAEVLSLYAGGVGSGSNPMFFSSGAVTIG